MFKRLLGLGVGALSALTAACDGAPMTQSVYIKPQGVMSYLQYATTEGPMLMRVHGNPFVTSQGFLDQIVAHELESTITYIRGVRLTTDPAQAFRPEYRVIVVLGADKALHVENVCAGEEPRLDPTAAPSRMVTMFCRKDELLSEVRGSIGVSALPEDEGFRRWLREIGRPLLLPG